MKVIFIDEDGKKIQLFENSLLSEYLYCVSRAIADPDTINAREFIAEMERLPRTRHFLKHNYNVKHTILSLKGNELCNYICRVKLPGLGVVQTSCDVTSASPLVFTDPRDMIFSRGSSLQPNNGQNHEKKRFQFS